MGKHPTGLAEYSIFEPSVGRIVQREKRHGSAGQWSEAIY